MFISNGAPASQREIKLQIDKTSPMMAGNAADQTRLFAQISTARTFFHTQERPLQVCIQCTNLSSIRRPDRAHSCFPRASVDTRRLATKTSTSLIIFPLYPPALACTPAAMAPRWPASPCSGHAHRYKAKNEKTLSPART